MSIINISAQITYHIHSTYTHIHYKKRIQRGNAIAIEQRQLHRNTAGPVLTAALVIVDAAAASRDISTVPSARALTPSASKTRTVALQAERVFRYGKFTLYRRRASSGTPPVSSLSCTIYRMTYYYIL